MTAQLLDAPVDLVDGYLAHLRAGGASPGTLKVRGSYLRRLDDSLPRGLLLATRAELTAFLGTAGWSQETRHSCRSAMRGFFQWAEDEGLLGVKDPSYRLARVAVPAGIPHPVPEPALARALAAADAETRLMLLLGAYAGLRLAEIAQVHSDHIEATGLRVLGKGRKTRMVPLHPLLVEALDGLDGWAFPSRGSSSAKEGAHVEVTYLHRRIRAALGGDWTAHSLRHRFASRAYAGTKDLRAVQTLLGHSKPETTARYTLVPDESLSAAVAVL